MRRIIILTVALFCTVMQGAQAQASWEEVYTQTLTSSGDWTEIYSGSTTGQTLGSADNTTYYYINGDLNFTNSNNGGSGLTILGTVYLYVPEGMTLTCTGANANETTGAGAGIELAEGNSLYLLGNGTINAMGGNAANGGNGANGTNATGSDGEWTETGNGGNGGYGGGGAGAGIGTKGGDGGNGGSGGSGYRHTDWTTHDGTNGSSGNAGSTAGAIGYLHIITSSINLSVTGGNAGSNGGSGGNRGRGYAWDGYSYNYTVAGGGGGGAGGYGGAASNIGTGGPGGGGGGGGAGGAQDYRSNSSGGVYDVTAPGGKGGKNANGTSAADGTDAPTTGAAYDEGWVTVDNGSFNSSDWNPASGDCTFGSGGSGGACGNTSTSITIVTSETTTMTSGIYTVLTDVTISNRITIKGNVVLNLDEGATLYAQKGIELSSDNNANLTINGPGSLTINGCDQFLAGIGAMNVGTLTINGGIINVRGGYSGAGIGGNQANHSGGTITINGGIVNAYGGSGAAGIGGGRCLGGPGILRRGTGVCGDVYIFGGQVTAVGEGGAGIGPGQPNAIILFTPAGGNLTIGWTNPDDFVYNSGFYSYGNNSSYTLSSINFVQGKEFVIDGIGQIANSGNFGGRKIVPLLDQATALPGTGTLDNPYHISNIYGWMRLAANVSSGTENYDGKYVRLENDLSVSAMVGRDETNSFQGTFLGNGKTLTVSYNTSEENTAPFRVTKNATIKDLKVAGSINTSSKFAAGLISRTFGTTSITNCQVGTYIQSKINGDGTHGGIVAMPSGTLNIEGCAYTGRLLTNQGTNNCGGFVGWHNGATVRFTNSIYAPDDSIPSGWSAITVGATLVRSGSPTISNCYYIETLGDAQGTRAYAYAFATAPGNLGSLVQDYGMVKAYQNGILFDGKYYVRFTLSGEGTEANPYIINNVDQWNAFTDYVTNGYKFNGKFVKLNANISISNMAGTDDANSFQGTFDGNGHKLTFNKGTDQNPFNEENNYCAPFRHVKNATFKDLQVDGTIYTSVMKAAGFVGESHGALTITGCRSSIAINSSKSDDGNHGGFVATLSGADNAILIDGCVFDGSFATTNGTVGCGGFVGWPENNIPVITNSLMKPNSVAANMLKNTFARWLTGYEPTIINCYYIATTNLPTDQGTEANASTNVSPISIGMMVQDINIVKVYEHALFSDGKYYFAPGTSTGTGTKSDPYLISNNDEWETFAALVNNGTNNFNGKFVKLNADISITTPVGSRVSDSDNKPFCGTFLGDGNTITVALSNDDSQGLALFRYINGATIRDLTVAGTIASSQNHSAGVIGFASGSNLIEGCVVTATLNVSSNYAGGIIGHGLTSTTTIRGCVFAGTINGVDGNRYNIGGIWGWSDSATPTLVNCLEAGTYTNIASMHPVGLQKAAGTITKCYYMNPQVGSPYNVCTVGGARQADAYDTAPEHLGDVTQQYALLTVFAKGILYNGTYYKEQDIFVTLTDGDTYVRTEDYEVTSATYCKTTDLVGKHQAWFVPFDYTITDADLEKFDFYKINMIANSPDPEQAANGDMWMFVKLMQAGDVLYANMPYVYKPKQAVTNYNFTTYNAVLKAKTDDAVATMQTLEDTYTLYGTYAGTTATAQDPFYYMNTSGSLSLGNDGTVTVGAFRWIMRVKSKFGGNTTASYAPRRMFIYDRDGDMTGVMGVIYESSDQNQASDDNNWYSLDGRRLCDMPSEAGVYIHKGVKWVIE